MILRKILGLNMATKEDITAITKLRDLRDKNLNQAKSIMLLVGACHQTHNIDLDNVVSCVSDLLSSAIDANITIDKALVN